MGRLPFMKWGDFLMLARKIAWCEVGICPFERCGEFLFWFGKIPSREVGKIFFINVVIFLSVWENPFSGLGGFPSFFVRNFTSMRWGDSHLWGGHIFVVEGGRFPSVRCGRLTLLRCRDFLWYWEIFCVVGRFFLWCGGTMTSEAGKTPCVLGDNSPSYREISLFRVERFPSMRWRSFPFLASGISLC